jgi:clathrin heavy chain
MCTHYDKQEVAKMCETVGMYGRALQNYQNVEDSKRVMLNSHNITPDIMIEFFGRLEEDDALACLHRLLESNRQNGQLCAEIAVKYAAKIDAKKSIQILESFGSNDALLYFLCNVLPHTQDPDIYFKYIECCARLSRFGDVEKVIKETNYYDPVKVRDFLMEGKFSDPRPLIYLCDMHNFIEDLTKYLYTTKQQRCIEVYLFKVNSSSAPKVLGTLLNIDCDETYIRALLKSIKVTPITELVEEFENRGKLRMLTQWLEDRFNERCQEPALHNALAKVYIDSGEKDPREFLIKN